MSDSVFQGRSPLDAKAFNKFSEEAETGHGGNSAMPVNP
jgi:hypothetical protein